MSVLQKMFAGIVIPRMVKVEQKFDDSKVEDVARTLQLELNKVEIAATVQPGMRIAIGVGSRGLRHIDLLVRELVAFLTERGAKPFIIPAMGSHGGATAEGQAEILASLGVTEAAVGCPVRSSMEVVEIGRIANGLPVYADKIAVEEADGIVYIARVKPHTAFRNQSESGLLKMLTIGLGKHRGAATCHSYGYRNMGSHILQMADVAIQKLPILFAVASVENAYDEIMHLSAVPVEKLKAEDQRLLPIAKENIPRILLPKMDVLIIDQVGKEISGEGMDPNVTGRYSSPYVASDNYATQIGVLDLTEKSHGNATGMGPADYITRRMYDKIDFDVTYANCITAVLPACAKTPFVMKSDYDVFRAAIRTCEVPDQKQVKLVRISDTLHLDSIMISESMIEEARQHPQLEIVSEPFALQFDAQGNLLPSYR